VHSANASSDIVVSSTTDKVFWVTAFLSSLVSRQWFSKSLYLKISRNELKTW
jgi:hypothetical protein